MRRLVLATILVAALGLAAKLAFKPGRTDPGLITRALEGSQQVAPPSASMPQQSVDADLLTRFPAERELVERLLDSFGHNARRIAANDGLAGLRLLDQMGDSGVCLFEARPDEFHQLSRLATTSEAARSIARWNPFLDPHQADATTTRLVSREISHLPPRAWRLVQQTPEALPFLLLDPRRAGDLIERFGPEVLEVLALVDLSDGGESLRKAESVLDRHGGLAIRSTGEIGPAGFLLVERYGDLMAELEPDLGLRHTLAVVGSAIEDLDEVLQTRRAHTVAKVLLHLWDRHQLVGYAGCRYALRLAVEFGSDGERAMEVAGPRVAEVVYRPYPEGPARSAILRAIVEGGLPAAVAAEKFGSSARFQHIVSRDGAAAVLAVASSCSAEEARKFLATKPQRTWSESLALTALRLSDDTGDKTIRMIDRDGIERVQSLASCEIEFQQLLPLYDLAHIGKVVAQGYVPSRGEFVWAGVDAGLVTLDAISLLSLQPEGLAASEAARSGVKTAARAGVKSGGRTVLEHAAEVTASRPARSAAKEMAQNTGEWLTKEAASATMPAQQRATAELAKSLADRSAIRLVSGLIPRLAEASKGQLFELPYNRLTKYVSVNAAQAGLGLWAIQKMEEYLDGRKPDRHSRDSEISKLEDTSHETH